MNVSKAIARLKLRYKMIKEHPVSGKSPVKGLWRYLLFNVSQSLNKKQRVYKWVNGLKFFAEKGDAGIVGNIYYKLMDYEESKFLVDNLTETHLFVDVGANLGHYTMLASGVSKSKVVAIEPIEGTLKKLKQNINLNNLSDKVSVINCGVGEKEAILKFTSDKSVMNGVATTLDKNTVEVEVKTLNTILKGMEPTFIKIDVEGYELPVIKGAHEVFSKTSLKYLMIEFNNSGNKFNFKDDDVYNLILSYDFVPIQYDANQKKINYLESYNKHKFNTLFIRKDIA